MVEPPPPPQADAPQGVLPREPLWIARAQLAWVLLGLAIAGVTAVVIRIELWSPQSNGDMDAYGHMLSLHGAAMLTVVVAPAVFGVLGNLVVHDCMPVGRAPTWPLAAIGALQWAIGATGVVAISATASPWMLYDPGFDPTGLRVAVAGVAIGMLAMALHLAVVVARGFAAASGGARLVTTVVVLAMCGRGLAIVAAWFAQLFGPGIDAHRELTTDVLGAASILDVVAALAVLLWLAARTRARRAAHTDPSAWLVGVLLATTSLAGAVARRIPKQLDLDVHLQDTTFEVGIFHLGGAVVVLALLAGMLAWSEPLLRLRVKPVPATLSVVLLALGMLGHAIVLLVLGVRGMPRRYVAYPGLFTELQQAASIAAFVAVLGAACFLRSFARLRTRS